MSLTILKLDKRHVIIVENVTYVQILDRENGHYTVKVDFMGSPARYFHSKFEADAFKKVTEFFGLEIT